MTDKEILERIERLERLAILTHGTLDVESVALYLMASRKELSENVAKIKERIKEEEKRLEKFKELLSRNSSQEAT